MFILKICNNQTYKKLYDAACINDNLAATDAKMAYLYAYDIIGGRFELGEKAIATSPYYSYWYVFNILKKPFSLGKPIIAKDILVASYCYINNIFI